MHVLHLVWNLIRGGTEGQCARVAMELSRRGDRNPVVVFRREGFFLEAVEQACGPVAEIGITRLLAPSTVRAVVRLARRLREEQVDLLHTWDADAAIFGQFAAALAGIPLVTSRRDLGQIYPAHKVHLMRRADGKARRVVANAQAIVEAIARQGIAREKFRVIPNILDVDEFDRLAAAPFLGAAAIPADTRFVMVARLDPEKDVATFLNAAAIIRNAHPSATLVIAGDGVERRALESMAVRAGLEGRACFLGDVKDVPSLLRLCDVGVLTPSRNEGLSNTILEYMAAGLPVVATDCGGNRELIGPVAGNTVVPVGDMDAVASACLGLARNPALRKDTGRANREVIVRNHRPEVIGDRFAALYREVLEPRA